MIGKRQMRFMLATEVAAGLLGSEMPLVVLPGGTTNATGRSLGIPVELAEAAQLLSSPNAHVRVMDMLQLAHGCCFGVVAMGIPGDVAVMADREAKDRLGNLAYVVSAIKATGRAPKSLSENLKELESKTPSAINGVITTQPYGGASCRNILSQNLRPSTTSQCRGACGALSRSICRLKPHRDPVGDGGGLGIGPS